MSDEEPTDKSDKKTKNKSIQILPNERVFLAGKTGSGKTYKAREMLLKDKRLIVFDTKDNLSLPDNPKKDWHLEEYNPGSLMAKTFRLHVTDMERADEICHYALQTKNLRIYIDEAYSVWEGAWNTPAVKNIRKCLTQGRESGIGMWISCQRPADIPVVVMSECEKFFVFRLQNFDDRQKLAKNVHPALEQMTKDKHGYWFYSSDETEPIYFKGGTE